MFAILMTQIVIYGAEKMNDQREAMEQAVEFFGGVTNMATRLKVSRQMVHYWINGTHKVAPSRAKQIEEATHGLVKREEIRPDVFA